MDSKSLELELKKFSENNITDAQDLYSKYINTRDYLEKQYYPWIQATCPFYTDHGKAHIDSVIESASEMLVNKIGDDAKEPLLPIEIFEILNGVMWHDIGNALGRTKHEEQIPNLSEEIRNLAFPNVTVHRHVVEISKAHTGKTGLNEPSFDEDVRLSKNYPLHPKAYAAIVRFADEISENRNRVSQSILRLPKPLPDENRIYWEYANCVVASKADVNRSRVVVSYEIPKDKILQKFICNEYADNDDFKSLLGPKNEISLIYYIIARLQKMNNERAYCAPYFGGYTNFSQIIARFIIVDDTKKIPGYDNLEITLADGGINDNTYPSIKIFNDFFRIHANWEPEQVKKNLGL